MPLSLSLMLFSSPSFSPFSPNPLLTRSPHHHVSLRHREGEEHAKRCLSGNFKSTMGKVRQCRAQKKGAKRTPYKQQIHLPRPSPGDTFCCCIDWPPYIHTEHHLQLYHRSPVARTKVSLCQNTTAALPPSLIDLCFRYPSCLHRTAISSFCYRS